jgi:hypothetical protein
VGGEEGYGEWGKEDYTERRKRRLYRVKGRKTRVFTKENVVKKQGSNVF